MKTKILLMLVITTLLCFVQNNLIAQWSLTGNGSTIYSSNASGQATGNFIGTTDSRSLMFGIDGNVSGRIEGPSGIYTTSFGYLALSVNGNDLNTAFGYESLMSNTNGYDNTAIGGQTLQNNNNGSWNSCVGAGALYHNTGGYGNDAFGRVSLYYDTTGSYNDAIGAFSMEKNVTGSYNQALGYYALNYNVGGSDNVAIGFQALGQAEPNNNVAIGYDALFSGYYQNDNVGIGYGALYNNYGIDNVGIGFESLFASGSGNIETDNNTGVGYQALFWNGSDASGTPNEAFGYQALYNGSGESANDAFGYQAGYNTNGNGNVYMGYTAGITNEFGSYNTILGYDADVASWDLSNAAAIGKNAIAPVSNSITLGNSAVTSLYLPGYTSTGSLLFTSATSGLIKSTGAGTSGQVLQSNGSSAPTWVTLSSGSAPIYPATLIPYGDGSTPGGVTGAIAYSNNSVIINSNFYVGNCAMGDIPDVSVALGNNALVNNGTGAIPPQGQGNTGLGNGALKNNTIGQNNIAVGDNVFWSNQVSGNENIGIGNYVDVATDGIHNSLIISGTASTYVDSSNTAYFDPNYIRWAIAGVIYYPPISQGTTGSLLSNDGFGNLLWQPSSNSTGFLYNDGYGNLSWVSCDACSGGVPHRGNNSDSVTSNQLATQSQQISDLQNQVSQLSAMVSKLDIALAECCTNYQSTTTGSAQPITTNNAPYLNQNYPNPFSQNTTISCYVPTTAQNASIVIFDLNGQTLKAFTIPITGFNQIVIVGGSLAAGDYLYTLFVDGQQIDTMKMTLTH